VNSEHRLAEIARSLEEEAGLDVLVMGGHAVRYYGVDRNTVDYDFFAGIASASDLREHLSHVRLLRGAPEGPSWRPRDFARFQIGRLPDGREEWVDFWLRNHLLPDFQQVRDRREQGPYGGRRISFISLPDLLRSKETVRETDWQDIILLEEIHDARNLVAADSAVRIVTALSKLRSVRGFQRALSMGLFNNHELVRAAGTSSDHPVSYAFLLPLAPGARDPTAFRMPLKQVYVAPFASAKFASPMHLALVEVVRRAYRRWAVAEDQKDKQAHLDRR